MLLDFLGDDAKVADLDENQEAFLVHLKELGYAISYISRIQVPIAAAVRRAAKHRNKKERILKAAPEIIVQESEISEILNIARSEPDNWHPPIEHVAAFMDAAETMAVLRCAVLCVTFAARPLAVTGLKPEQFDPQHNLLAFNPPGRRQTKKYRPTLPVPENLLPHLKAWAEAGDIVPGTIRKPWEKTAQAVAVQGGRHITRKSLRHFMATEMRRRKVPKEDREMWMGHRKLSTNDSYGVFGPEFLAAAKDAANNVLSELEGLTKLSMYRDVPACRQVTAKPKMTTKAPALQIFDPFKYLIQLAKMERAMGFEPTTPTLAR
ncbi:MAG: hypothetical protein GY948_05515 [Alphaproteobacteria bacterium]|nr:hypothetical protein [Alphaproteobacteria bacterium]